jgi:hypothetical protein
VPCPFCCTGHYMLLNIFLSNTCSMYSVICVRVQVTLP